MDQSNNNHSFCSIVSRSSCIFSYLCYTALQKQCNSTAQAPGRVVQFAATFRLCSIQYRKIDRLLSSIPSFMPGALAVAATFIALLKLESSVIERHYYILLYLFFISAALFIRNSKIMKFNSRFMAVIKRKFIISQKLYHF